MAIAHQALDEIEQNVHDYSAVIIKKERIGNATRQDRDVCQDSRKALQRLSLLPRPERQEGVKGREVIYVQGRNDDKLLVHTPGLSDRPWARCALDPKGFLAMQGEHYPITEIGLANLCRQLIQRGESAGDPSQVRVKRYRHARHQQAGLHLAGNHVPGPRAEELGLPGPRVR